jgi:subtilisin family serine protease
VNLSNSVFCSNTLRSGAEGAAMQLAVSRLKQMRIPVIAAMGNDSNHDAPGFPSCIPGVIKVGSVPNSTLTATTGPADLAYARTAHLSNSADPAALLYAGEYFFVAPGGGRTWGVADNTISVPTTVANPTGQYPAVSGWTSGRGTSFAAPLISGAFAIYRGAVETASVYDMSIWLSAPGRRYLARDTKDSGFYPSNNVFRTLNGLRFQTLQ